MSKPNHSDEASFTLGGPLPPGPRFDDLAKCATCRHSTAHWQGGFMCRVDPPRLDAARLASDAEDRLDGIWPVVFDDDHCGRYWPREPLHADDALVQAYRAALAYQAALEAMQAATVKRREQTERTATGRKVIHVKPVKEQA